MNKSTAAACLVLGLGVPALAIALTSPPAKASSCQVTSERGLACRTTDTSAHGFEITVSGFDRPTAVSLQLTGTETWDYEATPEEPEGDCNATTSCGAQCACKGESCECASYEPSPGTGSVFCQWWILNNSGKWELDGYLEECP